MKIVIITGASSGIGKEFARQMDRYFTNIDEFWLVARRENKLEELSKHLLMGHSPGKDVEKAVYGHRTFEELREEINKIEC